MSDKPEYKKVRTERGTLLFCRTTVPDTKYKASGEYTATIKLTDADSLELRQQIDALHEAQYEHAKAELLAMKDKAAAKRKLDKLTKGALPYTEDLDKETGEPTGSFLFKFKMAAEFKDRKTGETRFMRPIIFNTAGRKAPDSTVINNGSVGKISGSISPYYIDGTGAAGVSLKMEAIQVIKSSKSFDADHFGFTAEDDGEEGGGDSSGEPFNPEDHSDENPEF